jgi:MoaA/NifB/PqqE/SkfB family radical SAM enzyme
MSTAERLRNLVRWSARRVLGEKTAHRVFRVVKQSAHRLLGKKTVVPKDTFCVLPWKHLHLAHNGEANLCSVFAGPLSNNGSPMSVHQQSVDEIWNSEEVCSIRRNMVQGKPVSGCEECYRIEQKGGMSPRLGFREEWEAGVSNEGQPPIDTLKANAVADNYRVPAMPSSLELSIGNLCNLKCRMCNGFASSRIGQDAVHSAWTDLRPARGEYWVWDEEVIRTKLLRHPEHIRVIKVVGGEPLLIKDLGKVLNHFIEAGTAHDVTLRIISNGTTTKSPWQRLLPHFQRLDLVLSIDGFEKDFEYARFPAKWTTMVRNIAVYRTWPNTTVSAHVTLQNYTALNIVDLFKYLDSIEVPFDVLPLDSPHYLRPTNMPPRARQLTAARLRAYAAQDCRPENREMVLGLAAVVDAAGEEFDRKLMREFMLFTNDLDISCGQSFRETHEELLALITKAGFAWTAETRHARRQPLPILT